ncbi:MAG: hypothetical protein HFJ12_01620 [Bacilli bacterium]|nr:hypothetical protein [Bacilli bacterium]
MPKFKWENGSKIAEANVEINGNIYNVNPAQFEGKTPLSAQNLNAMQDGIYEDLTTIKELSNENILDYEESQGYLINEENKQLFNGIIPRYEKMMHFSNDEVVVGLYKDKPLYRKSFDFGALNKDGVITITTLENVDTLFVIHDKSFLKNGNQQFPLVKTHISNAAAQTDFRYDSNTGIVQIGCGSALNITSGTLTLEYTKTTD